MKSKQMFQALLDTFRNNVIELGKYQHEIDRRDDESLVAFEAGARSRDDEVEELSETCNALTNTLREYIDANAALESKLRDQHLDSYNAGVQTGRESEVTKATVKIMSDAAARTIFAAMVR